MHVHRKQMRRHYVGTNLPNRYLGISIGGFATIGNALPIAGVVFRVEKLNANYGVENPM